MSVKCPKCGRALRVIPRMNAVKGYWVDFYRCDYCHKDMTKEVYGQELECKEMISKGAKELIEQAVEAEHKETVSVNGEFKNHHEAYAVLKEEVEEVRDAGDYFGGIYYDYMNELWQHVKKDKMQDEVCREDLNSIKTNVLMIAYECIQVAAMCDKWEELICGGDTSDE